MGGWVGEDERKVGGERNQKPNNPLSLIPDPRVFSKQTWEWTRVCSLWEGDVKATDFLTSLAALAPSLQPLHLGSQGWGGVGKG